MTSAIGSLSQWRPIPVWRRRGGDTIRIALDPTKVLAGNGLNDSSPAARIWHILVPLHQTQVGRITVKPR
jgi:hypothetical protein